MTQDLGRPMEELTSQGFVDLVVKLPSERAYLWRIWAKVAYEIFAATLCNASHPDGVVRIAGAAPQMNFRSIDVEYIEVRVIAMGGEGEPLATWRRSPEHLDDVYRTATLELASATLKELWQRCAPWDSPFAVPPINHPADSPAAPPPFPPQPPPPEPVP